MLPFKPFGSLAYAAYLLTEFVMDLTDIGGDYDKHERAYRVGCLQEQVCQL